MITFEILSGVAARQDGWAAELSRQQQHLLAVLTMAGGAVVGRERLEEVLWDFRTPYPEHGVERVASELRRELRRASPDGDPVPARDGGYCLPVTQEQADVLRFRAMCAEARRVDDAESLGLMQRALREWGPTATGLHGGHPLRGLRGQWADNTGQTLRMEYRDAVIHCLAQRMSRHDHALVLDECEQRAANDPQALLDAEFVELWMRAASHAGHPARAHQIYQKAANAAAHAGDRLGASLSRLEAHLRAGGSRNGALPAAVPPKASEEAGGEHAEEQPSVRSGEPSPTVRGTINVDGVVAGKAVAVATGRAAGHIEGDVRAGSVEAGGELIGVELKQGS
ncbi:hypothetical protein [Actinomadura sp. 6K520]|uniref:AfsR/SARP family transcriptional regulator n=1 Tax=Actinomadura sp. 6K520 TaxID=2530364 RepID=UPI00104BFB67|nr:hypothetical protein [Actinomadura sp. 6K520]TDE37668.1 hypothetical protein E1289_03735 [Actinomadura sp. 6K520]